MLEVLTECRVDTRVRASGTQQELGGHEQRTESKHEEGCQANSQCAHIGSSDPKTMILSKYDMIDAFSCSLLCERVLPCLDSVSLNPHNLQASLRPLRTADAKQQEALRILEYVTGVPPRFSVKGSMWQWPVFLERLKSSSDARGRLARPLQLPMAWQTAGVDRIQAVSADDKLLVEHRFTNVVQKVALSEWDPVFARDASFTIEDKFSEMSAHVVVAGESMQPVPIGCRFHVQTKKRKAILDGSVSENKVSQVELWILL